MSAGILKVRVGADFSALAIAFKEATKAAKDLSILCRYHSERERAGQLYRFAKLHPNLDAYCVTGHDGVTRVRLRRLGGRS